MGQPCATFTTGGKGQRDERVRTAGHAARKWWQHAAETLGKGFLGALRGVTKEAADLQRDGHGPPNTRKVGHGARGAAVDARTDRATLRTAASMLGRPSGDGHPVVLDGDGVKLDLGERNEK